MLKQHITLFRRGVMVTDALVVTVSFFLGYYIRAWLGQWIGGFRPLTAYLHLWPLLVVLWLALLNHYKMYQSIRTKTISEILLTVTKAGILCIFGFACVSYIFRTPHISRLFIGLVFMLTITLLCLEKGAIMYMFHYIRRKGYNFHKVLLIGTGRRAQRFIKLIEQHDEWGMHIVGLVDQDEHRVGEHVCGYPVLGTLEHLIEIIHGNVVDDVFIVVPRSWLYKVEEIIHTLEVEGVRVSLATDYFDVKVSKMTQTDLHGWPLMSFGSTPDAVLALALKRSFDILLSTIGLLLAAPLCVIIALAIKSTSRGPVLFHQQRVGMNGRLFMLHKFRTMVPGAEEKLAGIREQNEMNGPVFKMKNDPRVTAVGKFLRKTSLDELPQLWNVLRGHMSLVGPRPPLPAEVTQYKPWQRRRLSMRPGVTCVWQVNGRNKITDFDEWMKLDLDYIDNWSLGRDVKILAHTVPVVLFGVGAK